MSSSCFVGKLLFGVVGSFSSISFSCEVLKNNLILFDVGFSNQLKF